MANSLLRVLGEPVRLRLDLLAGTEGDITGGTGKYQGARGEVTIEKVSSKEARLTFRIVLD
jgi:hypothetical protein